MPSTFQFIFAMIASAINERMQQKQDYVQEEVRVLKEIVRGIRPRTERRTAEPVSLEAANFRGKSPVASAAVQLPIWAISNGRLRPIDGRPESGRARLNCLCSAVPFEGRIVRLREADRVLALRSALIARG